MRFFNEFVATIKTRNNLPHWQQDGATFFVTYRLNDSIPQELMDSWFSRKETWLLANPKPWDDETDAEYHAKFSMEMKRMMDSGYGACVLRSREHAEIVREELGKHDGERYMLHSWVVCQTMCMSFSHWRRGRDWRRWLVAGNESVRGGSTNLWGRRGRCGRRIISTG